MAGNQKTYRLNIDGAQLRRQRELLFLLMQAADESRTFELGPEQFEMLEGLVNLTDGIADQAHDKYGIDCLLSDGETSRDELVPTTAKLFIDVTYDPDLTDAESLAVAADRLLETAMSTPGILDEYGGPKLGEFFVAEETT
jgi:hypothetical protein